MNERFKVHVDEALAPILPRYLELRHQEQGLLAKAVEGRDAHTVTLIGHRLKGSGASYGFPDLTDMGAALEQAGRQEDFVKAKQLIAQMQYYLDNMELVYEDLS